MSRSRWHHPSRLKLLALLISVTLTTSFSQASLLDSEDSVSCKTLLVSNNGIDPTIIKELSSLYLTLFVDGEQNATTHDRPRNTAIWKSQIRKTAKELGVEPNQLTETISVEVNQTIDQHTQAVQQTKIADDRIQNQQQDLAKHALCNRNIAVVKAIEGYLKTSCNEMTEDDLGKINHLQIKDFKGPLTLNDLSGLTGIKRLTIEKSPDFIEIADGVFDQVDKLEYLEINRSGLVSLPSGIFDRLVNLKQLLLLNSPSLSVLPNGAFDQLSRLERFYLDNTGITFLHPGDFDQLQSLKRLYVRNNLDLATIPAGLLDHLLDLEYFWFQYNPGLNSIPDRLFDSLRQLKQLYLCKNLGLTALPPGAFNRLEALELLFMHNSPPLVIEGLAETFDALKKEGVIVKHSIH